MPRPTKQPSSIRLLSQAALQAMPIHDLKAHLLDLQAAYSAMLANHPDLVFAE